MTENINKKQTSLELFDKGFNCCQAVFTPFAISQGIDEETSLKISSGFAAGLSHQGKTCGAVVGAHLTLGLFYGYFDVKDQVSRNRIKDLIAIHRKLFIEKHGSTNCKELLGYDPSNEEDLKFLREKGIFKEKCPHFVGYSVELLEDILSNEQ